MPLSETKVKFNALFSKHVSGFTVFEAQCGWTDAKGRKVREDTLVYVVIDAQEETVAKLVDEIIMMMDQDAILVEKSDTQRLFYKRG